MVGEIVSNVGGREKRRAFSHIFGVTKREWLEGEEDNGRKS